MRIVINAQPPKDFICDATPEKEFETVFHDHSWESCDVEAIVERLVRRLGFGRDMARSYVHQAIEDGRGSIVWRPTTSPKPER